MYTTEQQLKILVLTDKNCYNFSKGESKINKKIIKTSSQINKVNYFM